jgi:hypothetical protein
LTPQQRIEKTILRRSLSKGRNPNDSHQSRSDQLVDFSVLGEIFLSFSQLQRV